MSHMTLLKDQWVFFI